MGFYDSKASSTVSQVLNNAINFNPIIGSANNPDNTSSYTPSLGVTQRADQSEQMPIQVRLRLSETDMGADNSSGVASTGNGGGLLDPLFSGSNTGGIQDTLNAGSTASGDNSLIWIILIAGAVMLMGK